MARMSARERGVALDAHRDALAACRACTFKNHSAQPILSLARSPRAMLVGQAPGKTEVEVRAPFAGRAGKTLFQWLAQAGVDEATARRRIYIAAITRCFPGSHPSGRGDRVPSPDERDRCERWLLDELRIIRPRLVIPVGRLAIDYFLPAGPLEHVVGRSHEVQHEGGHSVVIPLPHPSGASSWIHAPDHKQLLKRALTLIREQLVELGVTGPTGAKGAA